MLPSSYMYKLFSTYVPICIYVPTKYLPHYVLSTYILLITYLYTYHLPIYYLPTYISLTYLLYMYLRMYHL
jgi:hypothetical protein